MFARGGRAARFGFCRLIRARGEKKTMLQTQTETVRAGAERSARPLLRVVAVGHVDHGKSTLIGRLIHATDSLPEGKFEALQAMCERRGMPFEWSFLLDAFQAERDQGITIDTTQIRFQTASRDFVLIDAPGHKEFLKNMITGAAQADGAVLVVDAHEGVREQTKRHAFLLHLLGIRRVIVAVNKMDKLNYAEEGFASVERAIRAYFTELNLEASAIIPLSARSGELIADRGEALAWYQGPSLVEAFDTLEPLRAVGGQPFRMPLQDIYKFDDRRIYSGRIETGTVSVGDEVVFQPSGKRSIVQSIETWPKLEGLEIKSASEGRSVGFTLKDQIFLERGEVASLAGAEARIAQGLTARLFWLGREPLTLGETLLLKLGTERVQARVERIEQVIDTDTLEAHSGERIETHAVADVVFGLARSISAEVYEDLPQLGRFVLQRGQTIAGGGIIRSVHASEQGAVQGHVHPVASDVTRTIREARLGHKGLVVWMTGLSGAGKTTLGTALERQLFARGQSAVLLDGDTLRTGLNAGLGFSEEDRNENVRRTAELAKVLRDLGHIVVVTLISPTRAMRAEARAIVDGDFHEVHVAADIATCQARDPKGLYAKVAAGEIRNFTGVDAPYEAPEAAELIVDTTALSEEAAIATLLDHVHGAAQLSQGRG